MPSATNTCTTSYSQQTTRVFTANPTSSCLTQLIALQTASNICKLFTVHSGCDDLLPILSFVIIRSGMAQLVSECDAMEEFIPEG